jgi:hypothetical protein
MEDQQKLLWVVAIVAIVAIAAMVVSASSSSPQHTVSGQAAGYVSADAPSDCGPDAPEETTCRSGYVVAY